MRHFANMITFSRIILSPILFFLHPFSLVFLIVYSYCGFSDILDGWVAKKGHVQNQTGAALDSLADLVYISVTLFICLPQLKIAGWLFWWVITILSVRIFSILVCINKYQMFIPFIHTNMNKLTGFLLFFLPFTYFVQGTSFYLPTLMAMCIVASISSFEELSIHMLSDHLRRNVPTIFYVEIK